MYPAVAFAEALCRRDPETSVTVVGTGRALEHTMMAEMPWKQETLRVRGVVGRGLKAAVSALLVLPGAVWQSVRVLRASKADLVIGTGGYTSPPVVVAAAMLGVPRVIVELNAVPGIANRVLGPLADRIFVSCEQATDSFHARKGRGGGDSRARRLCRGHLPILDPAGSARSWFVEAVRAPRP